MPKFSPPPALSSDRGVRSAGSSGGDRHVPEAGVLGGEGLKIGKGTLECTICLCEFEDDETLRLIPKCDHVFRPECIDMWLESYTTCPVCLANLVHNTSCEQIYHQA